MNHIPDKYEHLVRYYGYYSNRSPCARRLAERSDGSDIITIADDSPVDTRHKANWARLIQKVDEVDPLECSRCGATMRISALINDADVVKCILKLLGFWELQPETPSPAGPDPPWPNGETLLLSYRPVPDID